MLQVPPADRAQALADCCREDGELRREVESLLATATEVEGFIEAPVFSLHAGDVVEPGEGQRIGPYRIEGLIGRGGMGTVYCVVRCGDRLERPLALKLISPGMEADEIVRRFRRERRILAFLDHPNIARLLDAGSTADGDPYFVMDYVEGEPIDRYCDRRELPVSERIELFRSVCSAVNYAHQSRVVHRDLKPGNILVGGDGEPRLLDFGIAKLLGDPPSGLSALGIQLITPDYASPEQARGEAASLASDVYSLGVVLYELLTGHHPHRAPSRRIGELYLAIRDEEPEKPSLAVRRTEQRNSPEGAPIALTPRSVSRDRGTDPSTLEHLLEGDLDRILLKALRKWPRDRFASVAQLSEDLRRYQASSAVKISDRTSAG